MLAIATAGCVEPGLVECDDLVCPVDSTCRAGACVANTLTAACAGHEERADCDVDGMAGVCLDGVCGLIGCGNRVQTPDEVCDDGNTINGDGCSADCHSIEVCGDGIPDFAAGEQCDDGNDVAGDDCQPDCKLPRCGDGFVDTFEECDPQSIVMTTHTCADYGYYRGTLGCSEVCRLDPTAGCDGRCGDGVLDAGKEDCDGDLPGGSCLEFGYDFGTLGCSRVCTADPLRTCDRYGWRDVGPWPLNITVASGDGGNVVGFVGKTASVLVEGIATTYMTTDPIVDAAIRGTRVVIATGTTLYVRDGSAFVELARDTTAVIRQVAFARDGTLVTLSDAAGGCDVRTWNGTWSTLTTFSGCGTQLVARSSTDVASLLSPSLVAWHVGGTSTEIATANAVTIALDENLEIYRGTTFDTVSETGVTTSTALSSQSGSVFADGASWAQPSLFGGPVIRGVADRTDSIAAPPLAGSAPQQLQMADGQLYIANADRLDVLVNIAMSTRALPSNNDAYATGSLALADDGAAFYCGSSVWQASGPTFTTLPFATATPGPCWAGNAKDLYAQRGAALMHWNGSVVTTELYQGAGFSVDAITGDATQVVAISQGRLLRKVAAWEQFPTLPMNCTPSAITIARGTLYAAGCGHAWSLSGTTWTDLGAIGSAPTTIAVTSDDTIGVGSATASYIRSGGVWTTVTGCMTTIAALGSTLYGACGIAESDVNAFLGGHWSTMRTDLLHPTRLASSQRELAVIGLTSPAPVPTVWRSFVSPPR